MLSRKNVIQAKCYLGELELGESVLGELVLGKMLLSRLELYYPSIFMWTDMEQENSIVKKMAKVDSVLITRVNSN